MTIAMRINEKAPVIASGEIEVAADVDTIWEIKTEESWEGLLPRLLRGLMQNMLKRSIDSGLLQLKAEAERRDSLR